MRAILSTASALAVATMLAANVSAAPISAPSASNYLTVADQEMTVSNSYANLRQKPSTTSKILDKLPRGTKVMAIEKVSAGKWVHVKVGSKDGYIEMKLLK